ncbi:MAG: secretin N-terminal domain-containing protein [Thermoanaerobaculia bacterium]
MKHHWKIAGAGLLLTLTLGCSGSRAFRDAREEEVRQHWDLAVLKYSRAVDLDPTNSRYKVSLQRAKIRASQFHFEKGKLYRNSARPELAVVELEQAVVLDPTNQYAETELRKAREEAARVVAERAGETALEGMKRRSRGSRARPPMLEPASEKPISLNFPQPKPLKQIYQSLAAAAGINVIFDPQLKDDNVAIVLTNIEFQRALETLMRQENHFYKIVDEKTILIAADTPANRKTYEDLVIRTFYLSNADVQDVANAMRAILQTTRIHPNKADNSITLRDTADKVAIAERIVEQNDKQLAEVVVDVELLQINSTKVQDLGVVLSAYSTRATAPAPGGTTNFGNEVPEGTFTWDQLKDLSIRSFGFTLPSITYNLIKNNTDAELLAKPQLRISEGKKAQLVIGDRVPIPTTTFNTGTTVGGNIVPVTSFQYQDVGIKIEVEPRVHHNKEVTLKLIIEVSQVTDRIEVGGGQPPQPVIGTRTISSEIRLKDGETNFLAGLFRTDKSSRTDSVPFLGDIPVLGRLFSKKFSDNRSTDLVLTLTPHIIRIPDITEADLEPVYVGTDSNISFQGSPRIESPGGSGGPFDFQPRREPAVRPTPGPAPTPVPQNLVPPGGLPNDPFRPPPTPLPRQAVPPQGEVRPPGALATETGLNKEDRTPRFDFDPASLSFAAGQDRILLVRATGDTLRAGSFAIRYDPQVVNVVGVRPILADGGVAESRLEPGRVLLELPAEASLGGTRAVAEIIVRGVGPGRSALALEGEGLSFTPAVLDVR